MTHPASLGHPDSRNRLHVLAMAFAWAAVMSVPANRAHRVGDEEALQGTWGVVRVQADIRGDTAAANAEIRAHGTVVVSDATITLRDIGSGPGTSLSFAFAVDTLVTPRRIDLADQTSPEKVVWGGIYQVNGDTLHLALPIEHWSDRLMRPASFGGTNTLALTLVRQTR